MTPGTSSREVAAMPAPANATAIDEKTISYFTQHADAKNADRWTNGDQTTALQLRLLSQKKSVVHKAAADSNASVSQSKRRFDPKTGRIILSIAPVAEAPETAAVTNVSLMADETNNQFYLKTLEGIWQCIIEVIAQQLCRFFMPLTPHTRPVRTANGDCFVLSKAITNSNLLSDAKSLAEIEAQIQQDHLHGLIQLAIYRKYCCELDLNRGNVLLCNKNALGIDAAACFADSFIEVDQKENNPAKTWFSRTIANFLKRDPHFNISLADLESPLKLHAQGHDALRWLWDEK